MQITVPDDPKFRQRANAAGFASIQDYVLQLMEQDVRRGEVAPEQQTGDEWVESFDAWVSGLKSHNPNFDDSRESIYPVR